MNENQNLTQMWDKVFPQSDKVDHSKVTFRNRYGITLVADLYIPKNVTGKLAAIAVSGPFGAGKEQSSGLYAQTLAERGFLTIAFDPSYTGESSGEPRYVASPDINTEDFSAAVDYLSTRDDVDPERIGILGICGWGGMARSSYRHPHQGNGNFDDVRHEPRQCQRLFRLDGCQCPLRTPETTQRPADGGYKERHVCACRWCSRSVAFRCSAIRERLL